MPSPARLQIALPQRLTEGQNEVVTGKVEPGDVPLGADGAVMGIVEGEREAAAFQANAAELGDEGGIGPLMHDDHVGLAGRRFMLEIGSVDPDPQIREGLAEGRDRSVTLIYDEIAPAPGIAGLERYGLVAAPDEFAHDAAQKMRIAVVPVGHQ